MAKKNEQTHKKTSSFMTSILIPVALFAFVVVFLFGRNTETEQTRGGNAGNTLITESGDLVISIDEVSETATFYPVEIDGTVLEVLAVMAPDGTIRTAFNTCQVCYDSGKGYYVQEGDYLICQNCGNRFSTSAVEVARGGCNPVPIFADEKIVDEITITISYETLSEAAIIFQRW